MFEKLLGTFQTFIKEPGSGIRIFQIRIKKAIEYGSHTDLNPKHCSMTGNLPAGGGDNDDDNDDRRHNPDDDHHFDVLPPVLPLQPGRLGGGGQRGGQ